MAKTIKTNIIAYLILSLLVIIPLNIGNVFAEDSASSGDDSSGSGFFSGSDDTVTRENAANMCSGGDTNVKSSLILSIVTLCLPGILEKGMEWKHNKCFAAKCYYDAVLQGLDPQFCVAQDNYRTCKYLVGELFALPPMAMLEYFRQAIADVLANPVGLLWSIGVKESRKIVFANCKASPATCSVGENPMYGVAAGFLIVTDALAVYQNLMGMFENGFSFLESESEGPCDGIDEIKAEMEAIIKVYEETGYTGPQDVNELDIDRSEFEDEEEEE